MSGYVIGTARVDRVEVLLERGAELAIGDFVVLEEDGLRVLGIVDNVIAGHRIASDNRMVSVEAVRELSKERELGAFRVAEIRLIGEIKEGQLVGLPRRPVSVLSRVRKAETWEIEDAIGGGDHSKNKGLLRIGHVLSNEEVGAYVNLNRMVARHLAILSMTGGGKSNTVALIAEEIGKKGGTVVILDFHDEYKVKGGKFGGAPANVIEPSINPLLIDVEILMDFMEIQRNATNQRMAFGNLWDDVLEKTEEGIGEITPLERVVSKLEEAIEYLSTPKRDRGKPPADNPVIEIGIKDINSLSTLKAKIESFLKLYGDIINYSASRVVDMIREGAVNIVKMSTLPDIMLDFYVSAMLDDVLKARKNAKAGMRPGGPYPVLTKPILLVIEEAHILVSSNQRTRTKHLVSRIAREGRKFGVGLALVSQRPSRVDPDVLSQMNSMIALRMISKADKNAVAEASDQVSEEMIDSLSSLNPGEALLVGAFVPFPYFVKITKTERLLESSDPDILGEWMAEEEPEVMRDADLL